jgi:hypothetical protein
VARSEGCSCYGRLILNIARYMANSLCNRYGTGLPRTSNAAAYVSSAVSNACCAVPSDRIPGADLDLLAPWTSERALSTARHNAGRSCACLMVTSAPLVYASLLRRTTEPPTLPGGRQGAEAYACMYLCNTRCRIYRRHRGVRELDFQAPFADGSWPRNGGEMTVRIAPPMPLFRSPRSHLAGRMSSPDHRG